MSDNELKQAIQKLLHSRKPMAGGSIAWVLKTDSKRVRQALSDLMDEGHVALCLDGFRYEPASGGYGPGPEAA